MRTLTNVELLNVWERGLGQRPVQRALSLLATACPETPLDELARMTIGRRDEALLVLRERTFGPRLVGLASCPECSEWIELMFEASQIRVEPSGEPPETLALCDSGWRVQFRLPNSLDVAVVEDRPSVEDARTALLSRCLLAAEHEGETLGAEQLPPPIAGAVAQRMAQADPQGDVQLACACPRCGRTWQAAFDIVSFFWAEIHAWARRTLHEVHMLASAYGWLEADILALSVARRQMYLEMIGA